MVKFFQAILSTPLMRAALRHVGPLARCRRGVAALEFAIISLPLITLLFGIISVNSIFYVMSSMQSNAMYAVSMVAQGTITQNNSGTITAVNNATTGVACSPLPATTKVEYYACNGLPSWATYTVSTTETCATPSFTVTISVTATAAAMADVLRFFTGKTLVASATAMKQGSCP